MLEALGQAGSDLSGCPNIQFSVHHPLAIVQHQASLDE
jgi:hypothetical protein